MSERFPVRKLDDLVTETTVMAYLYENERGMLDKAREAITLRRCQITHSKLLAEIDQISKYGDIGGGVLKIKEFIQDDPVSAVKIFEKSLPFSPVPNPDILFDYLVCRLVNSVVKKAGVHQE